MAAAGVTQQSGPSRDGQPEQNAIQPFQPLWPKGVKIEVLGCTGDYESGKTFFISSIAPGNHREGHPFAGQPRTRTYDFEKSGGACEWLENDRIDVPDLLVHRFGSGQYKPVDVFRWWYEDVKKIEPYQFDVIGCDTIGDIEQGLADYVASMYADYGFSSPDKFRSTGGIFWNYVKEWWKTVLSDLASRCQTFAFTAHMKQVWSSGRPTSQKKPAGKTTLMELTSLYLWLDRSPKDGKVPEKPRVKTKLKDRLNYGKFDPDTGEVEAHPYLPPAFKDATPAKIRQFILSPPNYKSLKKDEKIEEDTISETEKLETERQIAEDRRVAEESALERLNRQIELRRMHERAVSGNKTEPASEQEQGNAPAETATAATASEPAKESDAKEPTQGLRDKAPADRAARLVELKQELNMPMAVFTNGLKKYVESGNPTDLSPDDCETLIKKFEGLVQQRKK